MIRVVAVITAIPGRREEILSVFRANVANVRAEKGCIEYAAHIDAADIGPFQAKYRTGHACRSRIRGRAPRR